jgi:SAM-dependent methyltransferase
VDLTSSPQISESAKRRCVSCGTQEAVSLGLVAAQATEFGFTGGGQLFECRSCHLLFLEKSSLDGLDEKYADLPIDLLDEIPARRDFDLALTEIRRGPSAVTALDIGCFRGDFLDLLPSSIQKFGIEPSRAARGRAEEHGIKIMADTLDKAVIEDGSFDLIFMMDVAEHLPDPFSSLQKIARWLAPGGRLMVSTGNSDSLLWRMSRLNYWYYFPQHISFCNGRWFRWAAEKLNLEIIACVKFSHSRRAYRKWFVAERWYQLAKSIFVWSLARCGLPSKRFIARGDSTWPDHLFVVFRAPDKKKS